MYARGILFGKMKYELGDHAFVKSPELGLEADIEFKVKGWVGGGYNAIGGFIKETKSGKNLFELSGHWNEKMYIKDPATGKKELFFDATHAKPSYPKSRPLDEQQPRESQKLWHSTTQAIKKADQKTATDEKSRIEDEQRREAAERGENAWKPKLFKAAPSGDEESLDWVIDAVVDGDAPAEKQVEQILAIAPIVPGQKASAEFEKNEKNEKLPSPQGKAVPAEQPTQSQQQQTTPAPGQPVPQLGVSHAPEEHRAAGGNDLIDFGQSDGQKLPLRKHTTQESWQSAPVGSQEAPTTGLQQPLVPTQSVPAKPATAGRHAYGNPIQRMDSIGGDDEVFHDAES